MTVFFTSDTHFGDHRVLNLYPRPFASTAEMDAAMLAAWNAVVGDTDEVWHLGDFARTAKQAAALLPQLHGRKHLIVGNNDGPATLQASGWAGVQHYAEIMVEERRLVLCHYAFRTWRDMGKGVIDLHGHSHGRLKPAPRQYDVGVDVWDLRPVTLATILGTRRRSPVSRRSASRSASS